MSATVHRFIPAHEFGKHGETTACGIRLQAVTADGCATAVDGGAIRASVKGEPFDCERCRRVLEIRHGAAR